jgi:hypothetical protein
LVLTNPNGDHRTNENITASWVIPSRRIRLRRKALAHGAGLFRDAKAGGVLAGDHHLEADEVRIFEGPSNQLPRRLEAICRPRAEARVQ